MVGVIETAHGLAILLDEIISGKAEEQRLPLGHEAQKFARMYDANWLVAQLKAIYQTAAAAQGAIPIVRIEAGSMLREECNSCKCGQHNP